MPDSVAKIAIITGAAGAIGRAIAKGFARRDTLRDIGVYIARVAYQLRPNIDGFLTVLRSDPTEGHRFETCRGRKSLQPLTVVATL